MSDERYPDRGFKDSGPDKDQWKREGIELAQRHDATVWEIGEWYLARSPDIRPRRVPPDRRITGLARGKVRHRQGVCLRRKALSGRV